MLIKLEYSPYFIADDIKDAEGIKPLLADETLTVFRYILSVSNDPATIRFVCNSNSMGRKSIEVLYDLSDSLGAEFLSRTYSNRYFHFVPCDQCLVSGIDEVEFSRKLFLKTVGQVHSIQRAQFTPKDYKLGQLAGQLAYVVPFVHSAVLSLPVQKWRQVISGLLQCDCGSFFSISIWKHNELRRFELFIDNCIQLLSGIDPSDSLSSLFRAFREEQPLYRIRISVSAKDQHQRQLLQDSVIAEFGLNNITLSDEQRSILSQDGSIDTSLQTFLVNFTRLYSERELIELILPPYSFAGPVSGMKSQIAKPFTLPDLEFESKYYSVCYQNEQPSEQLIPIGRINNAYQIGLFPKALTQHMFVSGTTGSGKTTFVKNVIRHLPENVHFLIIDPVKEEYLTFVDELHHQQLLKHQKPLLIKANAYSTEGAIQINPFVVPDNCSVVEHVEFLTTVFASLMPTSVVGIDYISGMLKELYVHKFHEYYQSMNQPEDKWLGYTRVFLYNSKESQKVFRKNPLCIPVLDDIGDIGLKWVEGITASGKSVSKNDIEILRYFQRWWNRLKDAHPIFCYLFGLKADQNKKGVYFKKSREFIDAIDQKNIVISLKRIRDPNEKKAVFLFFTGLLDSYRRGQDENDGELRHVTVLEEAHCIIPVSTRQLTEESAGTANTNANELISGMLSEIRAFGEGIIISEQSPSKIIPDAIINTSTKIFKRTTYGPDLDRLAQAMGMSARERDYLSHLMISETIAFLPEESRPLYLVSKIDMPSEKVPNHSNTYEM